MRTRSTSAPEMSAGVMTANMPWKSMKALWGMVAASVGVGRVAHAAQPEPGEPADEPVQRAARREGEAVGEERPEHAGHAHDRDRQVHGVDDVLGADQAAVEEGQARGHEHHQPGAHQHQRGVAGVDGCGSLLRGGHGGEGEGERQQGREEELSQGRSSTRVRSTRRFAASVPSSSRPDLGLSRRFRGRNRGPRPRLPIPRAPAACGTCCRPPCGQAPPGRRSLADVETGREGRPGGPLRAYLPAGFFLVAGAWRAALVADFLAVALAVALAAGFLAVAFAAPLAAGFLAVALAPGLETLAAWAAALPFWVGGGRGGSTAGGGGGGGSGARAFRSGGSSSLALSSPVWRAGHRAVGAAVGGLGAGGAHEPVERSCRPATAPASAAHRRCGSPARSRRAARCSAARARSGRRRAPPPASESARGPRGPRPPGACAGQGELGEPEGGARVGGRGGQRGLVGGTGGARVPAGPAGRVAVDGEPRRRRR